MGCIAPRKLVLEDIRDQTLEPATPDVIHMELGFPEKAYAYRGVPGNLKIVSESEDTGSLIEWSFK